MSEVTRLTAVEAWALGASLPKGRRQWIQLKTWQSCHLTQLIFIISCLLPFYFCKGESLETIHILNMHQTSGDALQTKLPRFIFSLLTCKYVSFSLLLFSASFHLSPLLSFLRNINYRDEPFFFSFRWITVKKRGRYSWMQVRFLFHSIWSQIRLCSITLWYQEPECRVSFFFNGTLWQTQNINYANSVSW